LCLPTLPDTTSFLGRHNEKTIPNRV
jgi:hypothetical protein